MISRIFIKIFDAFAFPSLPGSMEAPKVLTKTERRIALAQISRPLKRGLISAGITLTLVGATACQTTRSQTAAPGTAQNERLYWKVFPKSDNTFYLIPRPELTTPFSTPEKINSLSLEQAQEMAQQLNTKLQFRVEKTNEGGELMVRILPEPLLEDIIHICRQSPVNPLLENRCKKELNWEAKGSRPDIYLKFDACEATLLARELNKLYRRQQPTLNLCPQFN